MIEELKSKQVEMTSALDWKQVHIKAAIAKQKSMKDLNEVKVSLEEQGNAAKIQLEAAIADQKAQAAKELSEMKLEYLTPSL